MENETPYTICTIVTYKQKYCNHLVCYINAQNWTIPSKKWLYIFVNKNYNAELI